MTTSSTAVSLDQARTALADERFDEAEKHLEDILKDNSEDAAAYALLAEVEWQRGNEQQGFQHIVAAVLADPESLAIKRNFLQMAGHVICRSYDAQAEAAITACLKTPELSFEDAGPLWNSLLFLKPNFLSLLKRVYWHDGLLGRLVAFGRNPFDRVRDHSALLDPYFILGIGKNVVHSLYFERFMALLRAFLLQQAEAAVPRLPSQDYRALTAAMAHYCFHTDYIFDVSPPEQQKIAALRAKIENDPAAIDASAVALFACYVPLYSLKNAQDVRARFIGESVLAELIKAQIDDYGALQSRAASIQTLTAIEDSTSQEVQEQYESFPYPRWQSMDPAATIWHIPARARRTRLNSTIYNCLERPGIEVLIAGCGTGQESSHLAAAFPEAKILAIDISRSSLAYAQSKAEQYGLKNLSFAQADILKLDSLDRRFDYVSSFGVLHHLRDPEQGWAVLTRLLKPGGLMHIGLYSALARRSITAARNVIAQGKFQSTAKGMRLFRKLSPKLLPREDFTRLSTMWGDYYYLNMYRDLLFHACEVQFDIPRIKKDLEDLGLVFEGFRVPGPIANLYREKFPDDQTGQNPDYWHKFEQANPDVFSRCYNFWCRKKAPA